MSPVGGCSDQAQSVLWYHVLGGETGKLHLTGHHCCHDKTEEGAEGRLVRVCVCVCVCVCSREGVR